MLNRQWIGNDVVDLKAPAAQHKHSQRRFIERIAASEEQMLILQADDQHLMLWTIWAIKEASYKAMQKAATEVRFIPNTFVCHRMQSQVDVWRCCHKDLQCEAKVTVSGAFVHAVAVLVVKEASWNSVCSQLSDLPVGSDASQAVRQLALGLLTAKGHPGCNITRAWKNGRQLPPQVFLADQPLQSCDISLSHDGRFVAAALLLHAGVL